jgi:hypothetical protein
MAEGAGDQLIPSVRAIGLAQSGGFAGLSMTANLQLAELPGPEAEHVRELAARVLTEPPGPPAPAGLRDGQEYELTVELVDAPARQVVTRDGAVTAAQGELLALLRPRLSPG